MSAVAKHSTNTVYGMDFSGTSILHRTSGYTDRLLKEEIEVRLKKNNFNRKVGLILSHAWSLITNMLMTVKAGPSRAGN
jgi:hypothetical protein